MVIFLISLNKLNLTLACCFNLIATVVPNTYQNWTEKLIYIGF